MLYCSAYFWFLINTAQQVTCYASMKTHQKQLLNAAAKNTGFIPSFVAA